MQANQSVSLSKWWEPGWAPPMPLVFGEDCIGKRGNSFSFTTESDGVVDLPPWWPVQPHRCSLWATVSIGMSKVLVPCLSFGKGMAFCLLAAGPQGFVSSFQPQTRACANETLEDMRQCPALGTLSNTCPGGEDKQSCSHCQPQGSRLDTQVECSSATLRQEFSLLTSSSTLTMGIQALQTAEGTRSWFLEMLATCGLLFLKREQRAAFPAANNSPGSRFESAGVSRN